MSRSRPTLALLTWLAAPAAGLIVLRALGHGPLSTPPLGHPGLLPGWASSRDPSVAAMALFRVVGMGACWYLLAVVALGVAVRLAGVPQLIRAADLFTAAPIRRALHASLGAGVLLAAWAGPASAATLPRPAQHAAHRGAAHHATSDPPILRRLDEPPAGPAPDSGDSSGSDAPADAAAPDAPAQPLPLEAPDAPDAPDPSAAPDPAAAPAAAPQPPLDASPAPQPDQPDVTPGSGAAPPAPPSDVAEPGSRPTPSLPSAASGPPASGPAARPAPAPPAPAPAAAPAAAEPVTWTVGPGDSFWYIAATVLAHHHPHPSRAQLTAYWDALVKANQDRLVHPGNPDLIYAGQQFVLPPVP
jgi:hypothetical protein